jgi:hypothetical protein
VTAERGPIALAERIFSVLDQGRFVATYKFAVLVALLDLCLENVSRTGAAPDVVTTRQLAEKVLELYWPQTRPWRPQGLRQSSGAGGGQAEIVRAIERYRDAIAADRSLSLSAARAHQPDGFERLVRTIEWKLIEMPLPRLQVVGKESLAFLYSINWDASVRAQEVRAYQQSGGGSFDNRILLAPSAGEHLVQLHALLRPLLQRQWALKVAELNGMEEPALERFLFGADRTRLKPVCEPLRALQADRCFYCDERLGSARHAPAVDHFVPWARHPDDGLANLVIAHDACNGAKRDFLASAEHVVRWRTRAEANADRLADIASRLRWPLHGARTLGVARAIYLRLPDDARLWQLRSEFVALDAPALKAALG